MAAPTPTKTKASPGWAAYLIRVASGTIGPAVALDGGSGSWSIPLNGVETFQIRIRKHSIPSTLDTSHWLAPWWSGVLLTYWDRPIFAGPIVSMPTEDFDYVDVQCAGIRAILAKRTIIPELTDMSQLANTVVSFDGMSLGTIAAYCVQNAMNKPGGALPISFPVPFQTNLPSDSDHQRTYYGYDLSNNFCDAVLTNLSNVHLGPDIMFKPRLLDASRLVWDMWTGSEGAPRIPQNKTVVWDSTSPNNPIIDFQIVGTGSYMTDRVYSLGNGQNQGKVITVSENLSKVTDGYPFLETANTTSNSQDVNVVKAHGDADLEQNFDMIRDIEMTVMGNDAFNPLGTYWSGDYMELVMSGWLTVPDGTNGCRLITISGDMTDNVKLSIQTESEYESAQA